MSFRVLTWKEPAWIPSESLPDPSSNTVPSGQSEDTRATRRKHKKSRKGCLTCKRRHVRCDENVPRCFNCSRGNRPCSYEAQEHDDGSRVIPLDDEDPEIIPATITEQSGNTPNSNLSSKINSPERTSNDLKATPKRKLSTESLDPYGASSVRLTPSMREQLNYCKEKYFEYSLLYFAIYLINCNHDPQITWLNIWSYSH